ncbi:MAG: hypothetical protein HQ592_13455, partial [Planctomycetes bacterium]|nr:hypothetical protein [Planctomycetota bacterium]
MDRRLTVAMLILCVMVGTAWADVPGLINYQGKLDDAGGEPVSGVKSMTFEFRDAPAAGNLLGGFSETQNVTVTDGLFNVLIGSAGGGVPQSIFAVPEVYLSVTVEGEELVPRSRVASVGFAFRAATADNADALEARVAALEALLANVALNGNTMVISGLNVQIVNGTGTTDGAVNGVGNLIVGYNELRGAENARSGSHNIVVGGEHNFTSYGGLVAGHLNTISGRYASVSGGSNNTASGNRSSVSGGYGNTAGSSWSSVSGGYDNTASGYYSSVSGGNGNTA